MFYVNIAVTHYEEQRLKGSNTLQKSLDTVGETGQALMWKQEIPMKGTDIRRHDTTQVTTCVVKLDTFVRIVQESILQIIKITISKYL